MHDKPIMDAAIQSSDSWSHGGTCSDEQALSIYALFQVMLVGI